MNNSTVEILFIDPSLILSCNHTGEILLKNRNLFLSKLAKDSFLGYAKSQLHRIKNHKKWIDNSMEFKSKPQRKDFGLSENPEISKSDFDILNSLISKKTDLWNFTFPEFTETQKLYLNNTISDYLLEIGVGRDELWKSASRLIGLNENLIELLQKEKKYNAAVKDWQSYHQWVENRNEKRFELEKKCGYDAKHASHLVRLLIQAKHLFEEGFLLLKDERYTKLLIEIKNGDHSFDFIIKKSEELEAELYEAYKKSNLPDKPNEDKINQLTLELLEGL